MENKPPVISCIIPCFNSETHIKRCLSSILASTFTDFEILVADDSSSDQSKKILSEYGQNLKIKVFYLEENQGPARLRNFLGQKALGKYIFFLDIDAKIEPDALEKILKRLEADQAIAGLQPALVGPDKKLETVGHFLSPFGFPYEIGAGQNPNNFKNEIPIFGARTAALAVRKTIFDKIDGFDEDYLIYGEDTDLCWRIWLAGGKIIYFPGTLVEHFQKSSFSQKTSFRIFYEGAKNNTANILKNASFGLVWWLLSLHVFGWLLVSFKLLFQGRISSSFWVFRGLWWNFKNLSRTWRKRKIGGSLSPRTIFGPLSLIQLLKKGIRWLIKI